MEERKELILDGPGSRPRYDARPPEKRGETFADKIKKFNPYHGPDGRFTTAGSATLFTYRSDKPFMARTMERAIAREKERTSGGDGAARIKKAEDNLKTVLKEGAVVKFEGMDPELAQETTDTIKRVIDKYPSCKDAFGGFTTDEPKEGYFAEKEDNVMACFAPSTQMIHLNKSYYGDKAEFEEKIKAAIEKQFHPAGTDCNSVVVHEMGHAIDDYVSKEIYEIWDVWAGKRVSTEIWNADISKAQKKGQPMTGKSIKESLSGYASRNAGEYLAEGFSEALCSNSPRPTAKSILKRIENRIKKMGV